MKKIFTAVCVMALVCTMFASCAKQTNSVVRKEGPRDTVIIVIPDTTQGGQNHKNDTIRSIQNGGTAVNDFLGGSTLSLNQVTTVSDEDGNFSYQFTPSLNITISLKEKEMTVQDGADMNSNLTFGGSYSWFAEEVAEFSDMQKDTLRYSVDVPTFEGEDVAHYELRSLEFVRTDVETISDTQVKVTHVWAAKLVTVGADTYTEEVDYLKPFYIKNIEKPVIIDPVLDQKWEVEYGSEYHEFSFRLVEYKDGVRNRVIDELALPLISGSFSDKEKFSVADGWKNTYEFSSNMENHEETSSTPKAGWTVDTKSDDYHVLVKTENVNGKLVSARDVILKVFSYTVKCGDQTFKVSTKVEISDEIVDRGLSSKANSQGVECKYLGTHTTNIDLSAGVDGWTEFQHLETVKASVDCYGKGL